MKIWQGVRFFLLAFITFGWSVAYAGYIESTVWDSSVVSLNQRQLQLVVNIDVGPGWYNYNIFRGSCGVGEVETNRIIYVIVPKKINISGVLIDLTWAGDEIGVDGDWVILGTPSAFSTACVTGGAARSNSNSSVSLQGVGRLDSLPPGNYQYSMSYYVGNSFGVSARDAELWVQLYGRQGTASNTPPTSFVGIAACGQDSPASGATIDFGTVTSNGTVQPGPLTTLGLVCNYDVALNDVTYSLTSNNPVTGEPSTGQNVAVALTNGATVTLDGGNVTQPDPKRVSVNITPSIDTRGATAGEGTGSATLTFNYE